MALQSGPSSPADQAQSTTTGIALVCLAFFWFSALDATAKFLSAELPVLQIVWVRFVGHVVVAVVLFRMWRNPSILRPTRYFLQLLRGVFTLGATTFNFIAVQYLQLTETTAIMFVAPLVVVILAGPLLGEWAGPHRWAAIIVGFCGVLIVTRPGIGGMHWAAFLSAAAMLCFALYAIVTRMIAPTESVEGMLLIIALVPAIATAIPALSVWQTPPDAVHWIMLLLTGVFGAIGHWVLIVAYRIAPAPALAPFNYTQIVWMAGLGYLIFADIPNIWTVIGSTIIIASGLYVIYREHWRGSS